MNKEEYFERRSQLNLKIQKSEEIAAQYRKQKMHLEIYLQDYEWELRKSERLYLDIEEYWREKNMTPVSKGIFENEGDIQKVIKQKLDVLYQDCNETLQMQIQSEENKQEEYHNQIYKLKKELWTEEDLHGENN